MTQLQAIKILIKAAQRELKHLAFDANCHDRLGLAEPAFERAALARARIVEAIETLEARRNGQIFPGK